MAVCALFFWVVVHIIPVVMDRPSARNVTSATRAQTSGGNERTTHTSSSG